MFSPEIKVRRSDVAGLFNCELPDGRVLNDRTHEQVFDLSSENGWGLNFIISAETPIEVSPKLLQSVCLKHGLFEGEVCSMCFALNLVRRQF